MHSFRTPALLCPLAPVEGPCRLELSRTRAETAEPVVILAAQIARIDHALESPDDLRQRAVWRELSLAPSGSTVAGPVEESAQRPPVCQSQRLSTTVLVE